MHLELLVDHTPLAVWTHTRRAHRMIQRLRRLAHVRNDLLAREALIVTARVVPVDKVLAEGRGLEHLARDFEAVDKGVNVVLRGEVVCVDPGRVEGVSRGEGYGAVGFGAE